ncbi:MAG: oligopeptide transport system substrate-binding protein [Actinomycetota bacterium]|nr:oligopeptide transport system substrate-binding protein [Actinomycetota bacterium]
MPRLRPLPRLMPALFALLLFAACTGGNAEPVAGPSASAGGPDATSSSSGGVIPGDGDPSSSPSSADVFAPEDLVLDVATPEASTLDPMRIQDPASVLVARQLFEGLTRWDPETNKVLPAAAESWKASDGGRKFTFTLRSGMTFHDGSPVTSEDFRFAFDRIAQKKSGSELAYTLELVDGFPETNGLGDSKHLSGLKTPDEQTLVVKLTEPFFDFPAVLTHPGLVPVRKQDVAKIDRFLASPNGNGPFEIAQEWAPGEAVVLKKFDGFIDDVKLDGIRFIPFKDSVASWIPFTDGSLDVAEVPAGQVQAALEVYGDQGYLPFLAGYYYGFNVKSAKLKDKRLRTAINLAIDRDLIATRIYKDTMIAPRGIVPSGMPGFENDVCEQLCAFAPGAAKKLVRQLPKKAREVQLDYTQGPPHRQVALRIKKNLQAVGLKVAVKGYELDKYLNRLTKGDTGMYRLGWIAEYPVPDVFLSALFASSSPDNHSGFGSAAVDKLLEKAHGTKSEKKRLRLYRRAEKEVMQRVPIVPIGSFETHWAAQPNVTGLHFDTMGGFDAAGVSLAKV